MIVYYIRTESTVNINDILDGIENTNLCTYSGTYYNWYKVTILTLDAHMLFQCKYGDKHDGYTVTPSYKVYVIL
jgi:hypothetical protein